MPTFGRLGINSRCSCLGPSVILPSNTKLLSQSQLESEATDTRVYRELWVKQQKCYMALPSHIPAALTYLQ